MAMMVSLDTSCVALLLTGSALTIVGIESSNEALAVIKKERKVTHEGRGLNMKISQKKAILGLAVMLFYNDLLISLLLRAVKKIVV